MNIEVMEKKLYDACLEGDVEMLKALMREDRLTLAQVSISSCLNQTPLHLASMLGHFEFAKSVLSYKPDFASRLDSQDRSPLHVASANGYVNIVKLLLEYDQEMCQVHDEDGRTPLHLAVMNGQLESVVELMKVNSQSFDEEETVAHLCVVYNRFNLLIRLLKLNDQLNFSNIKDGNGDTILHAATALKRMQMIKYLVKSGNKVDVNAVNMNGLTALDIVDQLPKDLKTMEMKEILTSAGTLRAKEIKEATTTSSVLIPGSGGGTSSSEPRGSSDNNTKLGKMWNMMKNFTIFQEKKEKTDEPLLVAVSVIAAMAYQAATSPPGGTAGLDASKYSLKNETYDLQPGRSLLAYFRPELSDKFWLFNSVSFVAALSVVFLFVSGATLKRRLYVWLIRAAVWVTLLSMTLAYSCAVAATTFDDNTNLVIGIYIRTGMIGSFLVVVYCSFSCAVRKRRATSNTSEDSATSRTPNTSIV